MFERVFGRLRLAFQGLTELFSDGGFSGAVMEELNRAENQGIKRFAISVYQLVYRIGQVWQGFKEGFVQAVAAAEPAFRDLGEAFEEMSNAIGAVYVEVMDGAGNLPAASFRDFGAVVGRVLGSVVRWFARVVAMSARVTGGVAHGFKFMLRFLGAGFKVVGDSVGDLISAFGRLFGATGRGNALVGDATSGWRILGDVLGVILGGALTLVTLALAGFIDTLTFTVNTLTRVKDAFISTGTWIGETAGAIYLWFTETLPAAISAAIDNVVRFFRALGDFFVGIGAWFSDIFGNIVDGIASFIAPVVDFFQSIMRAIRRVFDGIIGMVTDILEQVPDVFLPRSLEEFRGFSLGGDDELTGSFVEQVREGAQTLCPLSSRPMPVPSASLRLRRRYSGPSVGLLHPRTRR